MWHRDDPGALERLRRELAEAYPSLHLYRVGDLVEVRGSFPIEHEGSEIDRFKVRILIGPDFPGVPPFVFETGGRIPHTVDRHVYPKTRHCCLFYPDDFAIRHPNGLPFLDFLRGPVRDYFLGQIAVEAGRPWPFGELGHAKRGGFEFYEETLGVKGETAVLGYLACISFEVLKGHHQCPCGSGRRLRLCHRPQIEELRGCIPRKTALAARRRLAAPDRRQKR